MSVYLLAQTRAEADYWARSRNLHPYDWRYVSGSHVLQGLHWKVQIVVLDLWWFGNRSLREVLDISHAVRVAEVKGVSVLERHCP